MNERMNERMDERMNGWKWLDSLTDCSQVTTYSDRVGSTMVQIMACCLTSPSHYLNWLPICKVLCHLPENNFTGIIQLLFGIMSLKIILLNLQPHLPKGQWVNCKSAKHSIGTDVTLAHSVWSNCLHYSDIIMDVMASQITSLTIVYSTVCSDEDQREHQSSASLAFVRGIHQWPVNSPHKWPVTWKMFPFDDVIMWLLFQHQRGQSVVAKLLPELAGLILWQVPPLTLLFNKSNARESRLNVSSIALFI